MIKPFIERQVDCMDMEDEVIRFKMQLLRKMPFYGDIVMRLPIVRNDNISTAQTNGRYIEYNPGFFSTMNSGQRNFVIMHEIFHVLLFHCNRRNERLPQIWNTAADMIVNNMLMNMQYTMRNAGMEFERPKEGIFTYLPSGETVENVYFMLLNENKGIKENSRKVKIFRTGWGGDKKLSIDAPDDIIIPAAGDSEKNEGGLGSENNEFDNDASKNDLGGFKTEEGLSEQALLQAIRESASKNRSNMGNYFVPEQIFSKIVSKKIKWQTLLKDFLIDDISEEVSYATPERKYLHMGLIIPGYGSREDRIEEIWAFVDSSGSIGNKEMSQFLTQLYYIAKEFKCIFNICYWDTRVTDVYKNITDKEKIFKSVPHHSGGTDINCVYRWIRENRVKPDVMLILTDGYFGYLDQNVFLPSLSKKTILVLSGGIYENEDMKRIGKIARLD